MTLIITDVRLIDANALLASLRSDEGEKILGYSTRMYLCLRAIIQAAPIINPEDCRPHGRWWERQIPLNWCEDDVDIIYICSECEGNNFCETPYCPHCGAKMDGKEQGDG